ncbi:hypothetical protein DPMN_001003 [Dreissena polymorpha]|uniref:Uncharacterized protein n=1 Tax=Dreissena polymorpha TaxID=45954 RepID=A0A9D4MGG8_DREPO|nr:hypothetical protein DPMN_001003 [Dreissena polymorpha]
MFGNYFVTGLSVLLCLFASNSYSRRLITDDRGDAVPYMTTKDINEFVPQWSRVFATLLDYDKPKTTDVSLRKSHFDFIKRSRNSNSITDNAHDVMKRHDALCYLLSQLICDKLP